MSALFPARKRLGSMAILEQKRQAVDAASRALCFVRRRCTSLRPFVGPSFVGFRPWIRHPFAGRDFRIPKQNRDFQSKTAIFVARMGLWHGFDDITRFLRNTKYPFQPQLSGKPPNQTRKQCSAPPTHQRMHRHRPPGSSRDLRGCTSGSSLSFFSLFPRPPGWTGARRGVASRLARVGPPCPSLFSGASFPMVSHPPPPPYYAVAILRPSMGG